MSVHTKQPIRRTLNYATLDEFLADAEKIAAGPNVTVGNWSLGQILWHLSTTIRFSVEGFPFQAPWFLRVLVAPLLKNWFLTKPMRSGFQLPKKASALSPPKDITTEDGLRALRANLERFSCEEPRAAHPVFGLLTRSEWTALHLRHAEMHMSFVIPQD